MNQWGNNDEVADAKEIYKHPARDQWLDEDGDCRLTLEQCDCDPERYGFGCGKCDRAAWAHISNLAENNVPIPTRKEVVPNGSIENPVDMWVNITDAVGIVMGSNYAAIETAWWFKFLQKIPPMSWQMIVRPWECPYAFALMELEKWKQPKEVLWAPDLRLILKFANYYYVIATASFDPIDEIKRRYGVGPVTIAKRTNDSQPMTNNRWETGTGTAPVKAIRGPDSYVPPAPGVRKSQVLR